MALAAVFSGDTLRSAGPLGVVYADLQEALSRQDQSALDRAQAAAEHLLLELLPGHILGKHMLADPVGKAVLRPTLVMDASGQRVYNEMWTADKWMADQATWAGQAPLVYIMIWCDKMKYDKAGRQTGHPLTISLGNHPVEFQRTAGGTSIVAMLPRVMPREGESKDSDSFRALKRRVLQASLELVLKPFKDASHGLLTMRDSAGKHHECRLALGAFLADLQEQWDALGLKCFKDVSTLATKDEIGDPDSRPAARREADMREVLWSRPTQRALAEMGLTGDEVAFWGFANTDVYQCVPIDTLHQCFNGISLHLIEALKMCIEATCRSRKDSIFARIQARFCSYRRLYHGDSLRRACGPKRRVQRRGTS
ncbi:hypothetical protein VaNZ11_001630 [Volvox africanus]|uniref:Uncharacterized protein n=1 Tax=Volvox africanus TaxID=51714 RepID=A0ABQ5RQ33_9CHLO|nr:hypothetical protein VaNZ11_001630 [Volvox africanus]